MVRVLSAKPPALQLDGDASYVIAGGLGSLGRKICQFMAVHGAKHIIIASRRALDSDEQRALEDNFHAIGVEVSILACDITDPVKVQEFVSHCRENMPPIKGVIQAAAVLQVSVVRL
jgi:NAD(P)-dependent dehydrogenase (short-subunit alcohol dehydrogenase family)